MHSLVLGASYIQAHSRHHYYWLVKMEQENENIQSDQKHFQTSPILEDFLHRLTSLFLTHSLWFLWKCWPDQWVRGTRSSGRHQIQNSESQHRMSPECELFQERSSPWSREENRKSHPLVWFWFIEKILLVRQNTFDQNSL